MRNQNDAIEKIAVRLTQVLYRSDRCGASVFLADEDGAGPIVVIGEYSGDVEDRVDVYGIVGKHPRYARKIEASVIRKAGVVSADALIAMLGSGRFPGIGKGTAQKIVAALGPAGAVAAIENDPEALAAVPGVGPKRAAVLADTWKKNNEGEDGACLIALQKLGISAALAKKIVREFHGASERIVMTAPYQLCVAVQGIGFRTADDIALRLGMPRNSSARIGAGLVYVLDQATSVGNCGIRERDLVTKAQRELGLPVEEIEAHLGQMLRDNNTAIVCYDGIVYPRRLAEAEESIAAILARMVGERPSWWVPEETADELIASAEADLKVALATQQRAAIKMVLSSKVSVLTGGPGTGKTKTLQVALHILKQLEASIALVAPTGKAAQRANETTGLPASTVHRLLGMRGQDDADTAVSVSQVVGDEWSMADVPLTAALLEAMAPETGLLVVGDVDQLPSVGPGQVLFDMIASGVLPVTRLTEVFRQAAGSLIIRNAHRINHGLPLEKSGPDDDFFFLPVGQGLDADEAGRVTAETIADLVIRRLPARYGFDPVADIQLLCPMNKGASGVIEMNRRLQALLNPNPPVSVVRYESSFGVGDKVIQIKNNYEFDVFNGDVGYIQSLYPSEQRVHVRFDRALVNMPLEALDQIRLAYAMTIHKSQGSESPVVILPITTQHYVMLQRNLLYTGVTRGKQLVIVVGQPEAVAAAIRNNQSSQRISRMRSLLQAAHAKAQAALA